MNHEAIGRIRVYMESNDLDAILLRTRANFSWVTGGSDNHILSTSEYGIADFIVFPESLVCVTNSMEEHRIAEEELLAGGVEIVAPTWTSGTDSTLTRLLQDKQVGVDCFSPYGKNVSTELSQLRRTLTPKQIEQYRFVGQTVVNVIELVAKQIQPGQSEYEIAAMLAGEVVRHGCMSTVTLVASDERIFKYRHPIPTKKRLDKYVMMVICAEKYGLVANATRFVHFGRLTDELNDNKQKCAYIDVRMNAATRPGKRVSDVFQVAVDSYKDVGFPDDWKLLHLGGPSGFASRETLATPDVHDVIEMGQAFAWNPTLRGIKSEDTIIVGKKENEFITQSENWPLLQVEYAGHVYNRPDILVRNP